MLPTTSLLKANLKLPTLKGKTLMSLRTSENLFQQYTIHTTQMQTNNTGKTEIKPFSIFSQCVCVLRAGRGEGGISV